MTMSRLSSIGHRVENGYSSGHEDPVSYKINAFDFVEERFVFLVLCV